MKKQTLFLLGCMLIAGCSAEKPPPLPVRIAMPLQPSSALMLLARAQGYFEQEGLAPIFTVFPSGKRALREGLLAGQADVASASDLPVAEGLAAGEDMVVLGAIQAIRSVNAIVLNADRGLATLSDLTGKRIGVQPFSAVHYFLDCALLAHGIAPADVVHVFYKIEELAPALASGEVDAISVREPFLSEALERLGARGIAFEAPWVYPQFELLVARRSFADEQPEVLKRILRALFRAEAFLSERPNEAKAMLTTALSISPERMDRIAENAMNHIGMPQSLLLMLEAQQRWLQNVVHKSAQSHAPVHQALHLQALRSLHPERVMIAGFTGMEHLK